MKAKIMAITAATLLLAGCSKDDGGQPVADGTAAQFTTGIATRTTNGGNNWVAGDAVGVYMKTASQILGAATPLADNRQYTATTAAASSALAPVTIPAGQTIYYPNDGSAVDFIAYHPWRATGSGAGEINGYLYPVDLTDQSTPALIDLLYSNNATGIARSTTAVPMTFNHALSKLRVNIVKGAGIVDGDFTSMTTTVAGMPLVGNLALADGTAFTGVTTPNLLLPALTTAASGAIASFEAIVIPQAASAYPGRSIYIALAGGPVYQYDLPDANTLPAGKVATYNITVSKTGITVTASVITLWTGTTDNPVEGGTTQRFRVGDYYPDPNVTFSAPGVVSSGVAPIGVVYWLDAPVLGSDNILRSTNGTIVSLDEGEDLTWGPSPSATTATSETDGRANMSAIATYISTTPSTWTAFPAFNWVIGKNGSTGWDADTDRWYLPARDELKALYAGFSGLNYGASGTGGIADWDDYMDMPDYGSYAGARTAFNAKLTAAGGTAIITNYYWSSSQANNYYAWYVIFANGYTYHASKGNPNTVRAVLAF